MRKRNLKLEIVRSSIIIGFADSYQVHVAKMETVKSNFKFQISVFILLFAFACSNHNNHLSESTDKYACPMHPQVVQDKPGNCPICAMDLVKLNPSMESDGSIMLSEDQIRLANISTTLTRLEDIGENTLLSGRLTVDEEQTELISSRVQGRVEKLFFKETGQQVKQGQALYEIYSESLLTLQQEYLLALHQLDELKDDRYKSFVLSARKKLTLLGMTEQLISQLAHRKIASSGIIFYSPSSGIVTGIDVAEGQYVSEGSSLFRIDNVDKIWVKSELYAGESSLVKVGDKLKVKINGFENVLVEGKVTFLSPEYRQGSQIITLRAVIDNPTHDFLPGMQASVILTHSQKRAVALPSDAVIREGKGSHVWILRKDGTFKPRIVKTGLENYEKTEIIEGVSENENVVITGAYLLYSELVLKKGGDPMLVHIH